MRRRVLFGLTFLLSVGVAPVAAQDSCPASDPYCAEVAELVGRTGVAAALEAAATPAARDRARADLIELTEIPAPPFGEEVRARHYADMLRAAGADSVWIDEEGNVLGLRRGVSGERTVGIAGHLDTVFPEGTDVTVRVSGDTLFAPGVGDDTRGLVVVLEVLRALEEAGVETAADVLFIGTVGEEGLGDLRGMKHLFREGGPRIDAFIAVDGGGTRSITAQALGSIRYRATFRGEGGHSWGAFGTGNPAHALGRAIRLFDEEADAFTAEGARTSYNVGRIGGGTSVNSIPFEAWMEVDMRSESQERLLEINEIFRAAMNRAVEEQNPVARRGAPLTVELERVGDRPSGETDPDAPLLRRAVAVTRHMGEEPSIGRSSTDSNIPISLGIPALTIGRGGEGGNTHAPDEWWRDTPDSHVAVQRALLLLVAEAGTGS
jgi:acetylornithine deacetylase/succinyl-diaminopimelate desuccinylase-like protein